MEMNLGMFIDRFDRLITSVGPTSRFRSDFVSLLSFVWLRVETVSLVD